MTTDGKIVRKKIMEMQDVLDGMRTEDSIEALGNVIYNWATTVSPGCPSYMVFELFRFICDCFDKSAPEEPFQEGSQ